MSMSKIQCQAVIKKIHVHRSCKLTQIIIQDALHVCDTEKVVL